MFPGPVTCSGGSFVVYSNSAKFNLGVDPKVIKEHTGYSEHCALAMAEAGLIQMPVADISVGVTGSFNRVDPRNPENSILGEVFIAVTGRFRLGSCKITTAVKVETSSECRHEAKKEVLQSVLDILEGLFNQS